MNLVERYIADVQRELPEEKREEIGRELNANIIDQLDALREQQGSLDKEQTVAVLNKMGHPRAVAKQFFCTGYFVSGSQWAFLAGEYRAVARRF